MQVLTPARAISDVGAAPIIPGLHRSGGSAALRSSLWRAGKVKYRTGGRDIQPLADFTLSTKQSSRSTHNLDFASAGCSAVRCAIDGAAALRGAV